MKSSFYSLTRMIVTLLVMAGSLVACNIGSYDDAVKDFNSNVQPPPPPGPPPPPSPPPPPPPPGASFGPTFSEIQAAVFTPSCASANCHGGTDPAGLNLEEANSYAMLVGAASSQQAGLQRVNPGNPDMSYLIHKLEDDPGITGGEMPPNAQLAQVDIDVIRQWITEGAADDRTASTKPITVTGMAPVAGAALAASPERIVISFDRAPDASTIHASTIVLEASGGDTTFDDGNEIVIAANSVSVPESTPRSAVVDLSGQALGDDIYRVTVSGTGPSLVMDLDANTLHGGPTDQPGQHDFRAWFSIQSSR